MRKIAMWIAIAVAVIGVVALATSPANTFKPGQRTGTGAGSAAPAAANVIQTSGKPVVVEFYTPT